MTQVNEVDVTWADAGGVDLLLPGQDAPLMEESVWAEVVGVLVTWREWLTWTRAPVWDREGMGEWDPGQMASCSWYPDGAGLGS